MNICSPPSPYRTQRRLQIYSSTSMAFEVLMAHISSRFHGMALDTFLWTSIRISPIDIPEEATTSDNIHF